MNEADPIVDEVRRIRDAHAAEFNYDPKAIFQDIKAREKLSGRKYVSFADDGIAPSPAMPATESMILPTCEIKPLSVASVSEH